MDVVVTRRLKPKEVLAQLQDVLPRDFRAFDAWEEPLKAKALMDAAAGFARTTAYELASVGINMDMAPVLDVAFDPAKDSTKPSPRPRPDAAAPPLLPPP